jgi:hypothetical protein
MACPVCFLPVDETATTSLNLGIFVLLGVTGVVLAVYIRLIVQVGRLAGREGPPYGVVASPDGGVARTRRGEDTPVVGRAFTARREPA